MKLNDFDREVILSYAKNNMWMAEAGREMYCARTTAEYHMRKVMAVTGLNPKNFNDLIKLVRMVIKEEEIIDEKYREFCAQFIVATEGEV